MQKTFTYRYNDKNYPVNVIYKKKKSITYRLKDGVFNVTCPHFVSLERVRQGLDKFAKKMIEKEEREKMAVQDDRVFFLGHEIPVNPSGGVIKFSDGSKLDYLDMEDLLDRLKQLYFEIMIKRTRYYENLMGVNPPYRIRFRNMTTRYGSNSKKTHSICYQDGLYAFSIDILDSLIVHELAHHFVFNHSANFYKIVLKYCPNYYKYDYKLKRRIYQ